MKISKTHHVTTQGQIKRNPRIYFLKRFKRAVAKERREHPTLFLSTVKQIVRDHMRKRGKR